MFVWDMLIVIKIFSQDINKGILNIDYAIETVKLYYITGRKKFRKFLDNV